jgi:hypothetical protein
MVGVRYIGGVHPEPPSELKGDPLRSASELKQDTYGHAKATL